MIDKQNPFIKFAIIITITILFAFGAMQIMYGSIPKTMYLALIIVIPFMALFSYIGHKHKITISKMKNKFGYIFIILGLLLVIISIILLFIDPKPNDYFQLGLGVFLIIVGFIKLRK